MIYPCGCQFETIDYENIFYLKQHQFGQCSAMWELLCSGQTKGVFQLESQLGQQWVKHLKPTDISHLAALIAILRPGVMNAKDEDGISMAEHYVRRKNKLESVEYLHPSLEAILKETFGVIIYQEQIIKIAQQICGFSEEEADILRKGIGKKDTAIVSKCKATFIDGANNTKIITEDIAHILWDNIEKSNRYLFNKCLSIDTYVELDDRFITLDEINIGDYIKSPNGPTRVLNKYYNGPKELIEITLESGKQIKCTIDHKFLCEDQISRPLWEIIDNNLSILCQDD